MYILLLLLLCQFFYMCLAISDELGEVDSNSDSDNKLQCCNNRITQPNSTEWDKRHPTNGKEYRKHKKRGQFKEVCRSRNSKQTAVMNDETYEQMLSKVNQVGDLTALIKLVEERKLQKKSNLPDNTTNYEQDNEEV